MSAHSAAATNIRVYFPTNCSAALKVLKSSETAVGFQAVCMCFKVLNYFKILLRFTLDVLAGTGLSVIPMILIGQVFLNQAVQKDETNHTLDDPQNIANSVCSASQRATKSVGIATPSYYANLVATRANKWDISDENGSTAFTTNSGTQTSGGRLCEFDYFKNKINKMNEKVKLISHQV
ncbi:hypothetical protein PPACK8108_LOCUS21560 [Phakopsora pachyrhizi]|uniref:Uncharacterized protein n=1 Tax=Phakopsora pachyrhizi TaxID=170000 RepID=A0AAV0BL64_PHAPC|nr:hypothetical protein PPACK8108_LOCUS21560 [Phakopsora pachyrhizi]